MRILVATPHWFGDALFCTPAIRAIRRRYPQAYLSCLTPSRCYSVFENSPYVNEVIGYDEKGSFFKQSRVFLNIIHHRFDKVYLFQSSKTKGFWMAAAGIKERIGFMTSAAKDLYLSKKLPVPKKPIHKIELFLKLIEADGILPDGAHPDFFPSEADLVNKTDVLKDCRIEEGDCYVVVHAGGNWSLKRWPSDYFREWIRLFRKQCSWKILLCGSEKEHALIDEIREGLTSEQGVFSICGKTSAGGLALLMRQAKFVLSNDSGPIHLAASQGAVTMTAGARIIGLFGPTDPSQTGPLGKGPIKIIQKKVGCQIPCYFRACHYRVCMEWLRPEEVLREAMDLMKDVYPLGQVMNK